MPKILKYQFVVIFMTLLTEIYMYTRPADYITDMVNDFPLHIINWEKLVDFCI